MWVQSNWFVGVGRGMANYDFSLRKLIVAPFIPSTPTNKPDPTNNLAVTGEGTTPLEKSIDFGHEAYFNDGVKNQSEDSQDRANKPWDFWGYTWTREYHLDRVVYTTGDMSADGGWFSRGAGGLRVQVRRQFAWVDVTGLVISPAYRYNDTAGPHRAYAFTFDETQGDGVRIIGRPGGRARFTSIAELGVYFDGRGRSNARGR